MGGQRGMVGAMTQIQHRARVRSIYKKVLKTHLEYLIQRNMWYEAVVDTRAKFEAERYETNPHRIEALLTDLEERWEKQQHPNALLLPWQKGSSFYTRYYPAPALDEEHELELEDAEFEEMHAYLRKTYSDGRASSLAQPIVDVTDEDYVQKSKYLV